MTSFQSPESVSPDRERRRTERIQRSPMETLTQMPALVVLERFPIPVLAVGNTGIILFANGAFAEMIGESAERVCATPFHDIFHTLPVDDSAVSFVRAHGGLVVNLSHADGSVVRARMSKSALLRGDDPVALATFQDLTEQLWTVGE